MPLRPNRQDPRLMGEAAVEPADAVPSALAPASGGGEPHSAPHLITAVDEATRQGVCSVCGPTRVDVRYRREDRVYWRCRFKTREKRRRRPKGKWKYQRARKDRCEKCGYSENPHILEVDHIDGDKLNNDPSNLRTLCPNCHRSKHAPSSPTYHSKHLDCPTCNSAQLVLVSSMLICPKCGHEEGCCE